MKSKTVFVSILFIFISIKSASANFFNNITDLIENNYESLRYGISVADVNNDGTYEFIVAGFGSENLALSYKNNKLINIVNDVKFADKKSFTIGVAACDIDSDGYEEIYFLNTGKIAHGGFLSTIADTGMGTAAHRVAGDKRLSLIHI